jgi:prolipoprotein diacylglyceryltransferase
MFDTHIKEAGAGILPTIFNLPTYTLFVTLGIVAGLIYYLSDTQKRHAHSEGVIEIVSAGLIFGVIGSKIPVIIENPSLENLFFAKSILGGLIGGMFGVILIKRIYHIKLKLGNIIAPSIALGMIFGRIGCFLNGCCYGIVAPWGIDFGDGNLRYPTQLFEIGFHLIAFILLHHYKTRVQTPGILFKFYLLAYFIFRFFIEFIRENPIIFAGMSIYQSISLFGIGYILFVIRNNMKRSIRNGEQIQ